MASLRRAVRMGETGSTVYHWQLTVTGSGRVSGQSYLYAEYNDESLVIVLIVLPFTMTSFLKVSGTKLVDGSGEEVILRGAGLGGWMK